MEKIISINKYLIKKEIEKITIHWLITDICNYKCNYCLATERFLNKVVDREKLEKFINTLIKIKSQNNNIKIEIQLSWWEPLANPIFFEIIDKLLLIENLNILVISNASLFLTNNEKIKQIWTYKEKIEFLCSFHDSETTKEKFVENLEILDNNNIYFKITYLIPFNRDLEYIKDFVEFIGKSNQKIDKLFRLIIEWKEISEKYNQEVINYYNKFTWENFDKDRYEEEFEFIYSDNEKKVVSDRIELNKILFENSNNRKYKWWKCYNYVNNYHIVRPDWVLLYGWCDIFRNTDLEMNFYENFELINKPITCTKEVCRCDSNMPAPKIYDSDSVEYNKDMDILLLKIKELINKSNNWNIIVDKIRIINNWISNNVIKINFILNGNQSKYIITTISKVWKIKIWDYFIAIKRNDFDKDILEYLKEILYIEKQIITILEKEKILPNLFIKNAQIN